MCVEYKTVKVSALVSEVMGLPLQVSKSPLALAVCVCTVCTVYQCVPVCVYQCVCTSVYSIPVDSGKTMMALWNVFRQPRNAC